MKPLSKTAYFPRVRFRVGIESKKKTRQEFLSEVDTRWVFPLEKGETREREKRV